MVEPLHKPGTIVSAANPLVVRLKKLVRHAAEYRKAGEVLLEGEHLCRAWAERGGVRALHALVGESAWHDGRYAELCAAGAAKTTVLSDALMGGIGSLESPAPVAFLVALPPQLQPAHGVPTVVLDQIQDAGNVGSILRSAAAFGHAQIVAMRGTAALWSPKVLRAGMGAHFVLRLIEGATDETLSALGLPLRASSSHADRSIASAPVDSPCAWVFGNEGAGVSAAVAIRCESTWRIEQPGGEESINVAAAAAIVLHATRQRAA